MKLSTHLKVASSAVLALLLGGSALSGLSAPAKPSAAATHNVIVILRDQRADLPPARGMRSARMAALASAQSSVVAHLKASGAAKVRGFAMINAVAATVSDAEAEQLAAHPDVQAVLPDRVLKLPKRTEAGAPGKNGSSGGGGGGGGNKAALCNTLEPEALQLMNVAFLDPSKPQAQRIVDGNGEFVTGKGVKVAWIADGMDPTLPGFTHTDGTPVFIDYQNFNGDPAGTPTAGGEAFGDASSIAAQDTPNGKLLTFDISQFVNAAHPLPSPCNIRIRGVAPGASLVGLNVFSETSTTTNSNFVQAIEYAVFHDDVDVINESFGGNPFPDNDNDPIALADQAAVAAGVTVVVSTGDAGTNGTMGTPSTDAATISSGATTQLRNYAQTGYGAAPFATNGWINNNISSFSSGGFSMSGPRVPDTVAPGDLSWALCSTDTAQFGDCTNFATGGATPIEQFGGTSESSPLTAGAAALVIQAYRSTHGGRNPSPALVKKILMSSATDLGAPPSEQGAGFINAYRAVKTALAVWDGNGHPNVSGGGLLNSPTSVSIDDHPRSSESVTVAITNTGKSSQKLSPTLQALGAPIAGQNLTLTLDPANDPTFLNVTGSPRAYITKTFTVPAGAQHLDAAIAWQSPFAAFFGGNPPIAYLGLIDPKGRDAAYSIPQGLGSGYGHVDIVNPTPGTWTAIIWTRAAGLAGSYAGPVKFSWAAERYVKFGSVSPASFTLAPGATQYLTARFSMPSQAGDQSVAIRFGDGDGDDNQSEIPIALRTLIPISHGGGSFSGTLTGGNGRDATGPTQTFAFDVPPGANNMALNLQVSDPLYLLEGLLVDPNGMQLSVGMNVDANGDTAGAMQLNRTNPMPGRWRFILLLDYFSSGNQTTLPFTAQIGLNTAQVSASGLPNNPGTTLSASGAPVVVPVTITNNGGLAQAYFADARLHNYTSLQFGTFLETDFCSVTTLPGGCFGTYVPTQARSAEFLAQST
ncbi:MAG TPA: S8 family serine peptidase, partial [Steroidobacteraceae bacterium]|nr:S8 family serine peptidase [Steroidobacteraceae bacterium]